MTMVRIVRSVRKLLSFLLAILSLMRPIMPKPREPKYARLARLFHSRLIQSRTDFEINFLDFDHSILIELFDFGRVTHILLFYAHKN